MLLVSLITTTTILWKVEPVLESGAMELATEFEALTRPVSQLSNSSSDTDQDMDEQLPILLPALRNRLKDDKSCLRKDDEFLTIFLRVKGYDLDRACASVHSFYRNIDRNRDLLHDIRPSLFTAIISTEFAVPLRARTTGAGSRVALVNAGAWDTGRTKLRDIEQATTLMTFAILPDKQCQLQGMALVLDLKGLSLSHVMQLTLREIDRLITCIQGGVPVKATAIHLINYPPIFFGVWFVAQRFLKDKIRKRVHFHRDLASLLEHFDESAQALLPTSLGGPLTMQEATDVEFIERLLKENKYASDFYS